MDVKEPISLKEYVEAFNDPEFRQAIRDSSKEKKRSLDLGKKVITRYKELLENDIRVIFDIQNIDYLFFNPVWRATWKFGSLKPLRILNELSECVSRLEFSLGIAESLVEGFVPQEGWYSEAQVFQANANPVEDMVLSARKSGKKVMALCPFHKEKTPSFIIYEDNSWHCFGCGVYGSGAIDFVMKQNGLGFKQAIGKLLR